MNAIRRLIWNIVDSLIPESPRVLALRGRLATLILRLHAGKNLRLARGVYIGHWLSRITIGDDVLLMFGTLIRNSSPDTEIVIGNNVQVGAYTVIQTGTHNIGSHAERAGPAYCESIRIGTGCWLGLRVTVVAGAKIGDGSVIGAGSVVSGDIPPDTLAVTAPARVIRHLEP